MTAVTGSETGFLHRMLEEAWRRAGMRRRRWLTAVALITLVGIAVAIDLGIGRPGGGAGVGLGSQAARQTAEGHLAPPAIPPVTTYRQRIQSVYGCSPMHRLPAVARVLELPRNAQSSMLDAARYGEGHEFIAVRFRNSDGTMRMGVWYQARRAVRYYPLNMTAAAISGGMGTRFPPFATRLNAEAAAYCATALAPA